MAHRFSEKLRELLTQKKITGYRIAKVSGLDASFMTRIINGDRTPSVDAAEKIADAIGVDRRLLKSWLAEDMGLAGSGRGDGDGAYGSGNPDGSGSGSGDGAYGWQAKPSITGIDEASELRKRAVIAGYLRQKLPFSFRLWQMTTIAH